MPETKRSRPGGETEAAKIQRASGSSTSLTLPADRLADLDALAESLTGYLVVQVVVDDAGHRRTTIYRSAAAAQRAVERARERGRTAHVSLCQLLPIGVIGGELL